MERIELRDGAWLELYTRFLDSARAASAMAALKTEVPWEAREIRIFGKSVLQPRLVAWVGDAEAIYTYSGVRHEPLAWTPTLAALRGEVAQRTELRFNSVLCNLYRNGDDSMGLHSDAEPELGPEPVVASLSLGATRRFQLRARDGEHALDLPLEDGSLLVMRGTTQRAYRHGVPKQRAIEEPRINLTFRAIIPRA